MSPAQIRAGQDFPPLIVRPEFKRSTGVALFEGGWAISQLWLFWVAPIVGAALAGVVYNWLGGED